MSQPHHDLHGAQRLDAWVLRHPWHPRVLPFLIYSLFLAVIPSARQYWPDSYPIIYTIQCGVVLIVLWHFKHVLPELNARFHWLAVVVGVGVAAAWIALGWLMAGEFPVRWHALFDGQPLGVIDYSQPGITQPALATSVADGPFDFRDPRVMGPAVGWIALTLRLLGMSIVVPMFEELFIRSLLLRSLARFRRTVIGVFQIVQDMPVIGEWLMGTQWGTKADRHPPIFGNEFQNNPLGTVTFFGVAASTIIFASYHHPRDWPGCVACGVAYCLLVAATNRRPGESDQRNLGLGPVIWAHGITNALLWAYTIYTGDWQFL